MNSNFYPPLGIALVVPALTFNSAPTVDNYAASYGSQSSSFFYSTLTETSATPSEYTIEAASQLLFVETINHFFSALSDEQKSLPLEAQQLLEEHILELC